MPVESSSTLCRPSLTGGGNDVRHLVCSVRDALSTMDHIRRVVQMIRETMLLPLDDRLQGVSASIAAACAKVEASMTTCLANPALERFVNTAGVARMLRETLLRWTVTSAVCEEEQYCGFRVARLDRTGLGLSAALRRELADELEVAAGAAMMIAGTLSAVSRDALDSASTPLYVSLLELATCASVCVGDELQALLSAEKTVAGTVAPEPSCDDDVKTAQQLANRGACAKLMRTVKCLSNETCAAVPVQLVGVVECLMRLLQCEQSLVGTLSLLATRVVEDAAALLDAAKAQETELLEMAKWYDQSSIAVHEWQREQARRQTAKTQYELRVAKLQEELDALAAAEEDQRRQFSEQFGSFLPKSGTFQSVRETTVERFVLTSLHQ